MKKLPNKIYGYIAEYHKVGKRFFLHVCDAWALGRPFHFKISDGPKMARAALSRRVIDGQCAAMYRPSGVTPAVCCLSARRATYGTYKPPLEGYLGEPKMARLKLRRPVHGATAKSVQCV